MPKPVPPHALLDYLISEKHMKNDAAISRKLGVNSSVLSKIRHCPEMYPVSPEIRLGVMRAFRMPLAKVDELAPEAANPPKKTKQKGEK